MRIAYTAAPESTADTWTSPSEVTTTLVVPQPSGSELSPRQGLHKDRSARCRLLHILDSDSYPIHEQRSLQDPMPAEQLLLDKAGSLHVIGCISTQEQRVESPHLSVYFTRLKGLITFPGDLAQSSNSPPVQGGRSRGRGSSWHLSWRLGSRLGDSTVRTWLPNNSCVLRLST